MPEKSTLSAREVATVLGVSVSTVHLQAREGRLPVIKLGDRLLFPAAAIKHLADYGKLPDPHTTSGQDSARLVLEVELQTAQARVAILQGMLAGAAPIPEVPNSVLPVSRSGRVGRVVLREV